MTHALPEYAELFNKRGRDYHEAMLRFPLARAEEFLILLRHADIRARQTVCDYPSGGGYLEGFLTVPVDLHLLETSKVFLSCVAEHSQAKRLFVENGHIPMSDSSVDRFVSLAGLHHIIDKGPLFREVYRCLKPQGIFVIADVRVGSSVDIFLNQFVHQHSEEGHEGLFLNEQTRDELQSSGYRISYIQPIEYHWVFPSIADMTLYCRLMFGISKATDAQIEHAVESILGTHQKDGSYYLNWELLFIVANKA
jgi:SAM-dependent methyltransferase